MSSCSYILSIFSSTKKYCTIYIIRTYFHPALSLFLPSLFLKYTSWHFHLSNCSFPKQTYQMLKPRHLHKNDIPIPSLKIVLQVYLLHPFPLGGLIKLEKWQNIPRHFSPKPPLYTSSGSLLPSFNSETISNSRDELKGSQL